jgi:hypothetical protein
LEIIRRDSSNVHGTLLGLGTPAQDYRMSTLGQLRGGYACVDDLRDNFRPSITKSKLLSPLTAVRLIVADVPVNVKDTPVPGQVSSLVEGLTRPRYRNPAGAAATRPDPVAAPATIWANNSSEQRILRSDLRWKEYVTGLRPLTRGALGPSYTRPGIAKSGLVELAPSCFCHAGNLNVMKYIKYVNGIGKSQGHYNFSGFSSSLGPVG